MKNHPKTKLLLLLAILSYSLLSSCKDEIEIFNIQRIGIFSFSTDNLNTQYADAVNFYTGKTVVHYYDDGSSEVFKRYLLTADGTTDTGNSFSINIEIDVVNDGEFIEIYRPEYQKNVGGIYSFNYLEEVSDNTYESYEMDPSTLAENYCRIERQNMDEKLLLGDFFARLQNSQDSEERIVFYQGIFKDISYAIQ